MEPRTEIRLFGSFQWESGGLYDVPVQLTLKVPTALPEVLKRLNISPDKVQLVMINHRAVPRDAQVHPGDRLSIFPKEYPVFPDWKDFRQGWRSAQR